MGQRVERHAAFFMLDEAVGHDVGVHAHGAGHAVVTRVVAHHEDLVGAKAADLKILLVVAGVRLGEMAVLVRRHTLEERGVHACPGEALCGAHSGEDRVRRQYEAVALLVQARHDLRREGCRLRLFLKLAEPGRVELLEQLLPGGRLPVGLAHVAREARPEALLVGGVVLAAGKHGLQVLHDAVAYLLAVVALGLEERAHQMQVVLEELLEVHGKKRSVQVEKNRLIHESSPFNGV